MAVRYGKLPSEILNLTVEEFSINSIVFELGTKYEHSARSGKPMVLSSGTDDPMELPRKLDAMLSQVSGKKRKQRK